MAHALAAVPHLTTLVQALVSVFESMNVCAQVTIVSADMRHWVAPEPADILVSELLGSFGDNELSPECLDGAQRFLAPSGACCRVCSSVLVACVGLPACYLCVCEWECVAAAVAALHVPILLCLNVAG